MDLHVGIRAALVQTVETANPTGHVDARCHPRLTNIRLDLTVVAAQAERTKATKYGRVKGVGVTGVSLQFRGTCRWWIRKWEVELFCLGCTTTEIPEAWNPSRILEY